MNKNLINSTNFFAAALQPVKLYLDVAQEKLQILKENKGKAGVYRWTNKTNGNSYVGSSVDLGNRLRQYLKLSYLSRNKMIISKALIKHGYNNFTLEILEYSNKDQVINREQYYFNLLWPVYNILRTAGSSWGFKHSEETKAKLIAAWTDERKASASAINKGKKHSLEAKFKISASWTAERLANHTEQLKSINANADIQAKRLANLKNYNFSEKNKEHLRRVHESLSHGVEVLDLQTNEKTFYPSIREAAKSIGYDNGQISKGLKRQKEKGVDFLLVKKKRYKITKID